MRRVVVITAISVMLLVGQPAADAHPVTQFNACAAITQNGPRCFANGLSYHYGMTVRLRARVLPAHAGRAEVIRKRPGGRHFLQVGSAPDQPRGADPLELADHAE